MCTFQAAVQYDDFRGEVACDRSDHKNLRDILAARDLVNDDEYVMGFRMGASGLTGEAIAEVSMVIYLADQPFEQGLTAIRAVEIIMPPADALSYFKRFDLVATNGVDTTQAVVDGPHY